MRHARASLLEYLKVPFAGDELAAELLLGAILSRLRTRGAHQPIGPLFVNFSKDLSLAGKGQPSGAAIVQRFVEQVLPVSLLVPLSIAQLNNYLYAPKKCFQSNRLVRGRLQLAAGSFVVIDESDMNEGKLIDRGVRNLQGFSKIITSQTLPYDFVYDVLDYETDIVFSMFSFGKSLLPVCFGSRDGITST